MIHEHTFNGKNKIHIYKRKYLGKGMYYQRGIIHNVTIGDLFTTFMAPKMNLIVDKIISVNDSKAKFENPEYGKNSLCELELHDPDFSDNPNFEYKILQNI